MRTAALLLALAAAGCELSPPCQKVAKIVCDVGGPGEGDSCAFLLHRERGDERAQEICRGMLPAAEALGKNPQNPAAIAVWRDRRKDLEPLGFTADARKHRIDVKLKEAGGEAGNLVDKAERVMEDGERLRTEQAERAFDAVNQ